MKRLIFIAFALLPNTVLAGLGLSVASESENISGNITTQWRHFQKAPLPQNATQHNDYLSVSVEPEFYFNWEDSNQSLTFTPFARIDQHDSERTHADVRELVWQKVFEDWELTVGISKVYWGVTESQHLVDVINQTDFVENIDGEEKLGQPMIKTSIERDWGVLDIYILPGFRERTFAGEPGRPRTFPRVDSAQAQYESSDQDRHTDFALRWFQTIGDWEIGLSHFSGTSREPVFQAGTKFSQPVLIPFYPQMKQTSLDIQATTEEWLWKLELISRDWLNAALIEEHFLALTAGTEYTFVGINDSDADLGLVIEYLYDDRDEQATSFFENDIMMGLRLAMNDEASTDALLGFIVDADTHETFITLESSTRLGDSWKLEAELRSFHHIKPSSLLQSLSKDNFVLINLGYYF
jgi:hypothetical protein